ncbi:MAG: sigma-70 family RNA polymerase sigma factor [Christensenellaceae bacterium]
MEDYRKISDEELAVISRADECAAEALMTRYKKAVKSIARQYFLAGGEEDDLIQEGTLGLFKAITTYDGVSAFKNYALKCIRSSIISTVRKSTSDKSKALNGYIPIYAGEDDDKTPFIKDGVIDPEEEYINVEAAREFMANVKQALSGYEYDILTTYLEGYSYADIAARVKKNVKSVDNAVQRIRKKIAKVKSSGVK